MLSSKEQAYLDAFTRIVDGSQKETDWTTFYQNVVYLIHNTAQRILGDYQHAEDVVQEVFCTVRKQAPSFTWRNNLDDRGRLICLRAWLVRIASNQAINRAQKSHQREKPTEKFKSMIKYLRTPLMNISLQFVVH